MTLREVSGRDVFIAGSIGPLGDAGDPRKTTPLSSRSRQRLEGRGVDLFMVETFYDLDELRTAIAAVRAVSSLPIVALLTFDEDAQPSAASQPRTRRGAARDVAAIGANHGLGLQASCAIERMGGSGKPLAALPNVGLASLAGQRIVFPHATPDYFAEFAAHARELGARIIGAAAARHRPRSPRFAAPSTRSEARVRRSSRQRRDRRRAAGPRARRCYSESCAPEFVVSVEIDPPRGGNAQVMLDLARALKESATSTSSTSTTTCVPARV